jgi:hypothetical protein
VKVVSYERTDSHHRYVVSSVEGRSVEVLYRRRRSALPLQAEGGIVVGWEKAEEVQAFREASDWLSRFLHQDGSPRRGDQVFSSLGLPDEA